MSAEEIAVDALRLIDRSGCHKIAAGYPRCCDPRSGMERGAEYGSDAWCEACIARDALDRMRTGDAPEPSWQTILQAERDEAVKRSEAVVSVAQHMADSWEALRRGAASVLSIPIDRVNEVGDVVREAR